MSVDIAVIDYGMGNLRSVSQAVAHVARTADDATGEVRLTLRIATEKKGRLTAQLQRSGLGV